MEQAKIVLCDTDVMIEFYRGFVNLICTYSLSHRLAIPDGFIAPTAIENDVELFTLNKKDFRFIEGLKLYQ